MSGACGASPAHVLPAMRIQIANDNGQRFIGASLETRPVHGTPKVSAIVSLRGAAAQASRPRPRDYCETLGMFAFFMSSLRALRFASGAT